MPAQRIVALRSRQERAAARAGLGRLAIQRVQPKTRSMYQDSVRKFLLWLHSHGVAAGGTLEELNAQLECYIEFLWETGGTRNDAGLVLSGISFALRRKRILNGSWELLKTWCRVEVPQRAPPLPALTVQAMAGLCIQWGFFDVALLLLVAFSGFLRTMEGLSLRQWQLVLDVSRGSATVQLPDSKSGTRLGRVEVVLFHDGFCVRAASKLRALLPNEGPILQRSVPAYRAAFHGALLHFRLQEYLYQPYSLRRGGATHAWALGAAFDRVQEQGRWSDARTARIYLTEGMSWLQEASYDPATLAMQNAYAQLLREWVDG